MNCEMVCASYLLCSHGANDRASFSLVDTSSNLALIGVVPEGKQELALGRRRKPEPRKAGCKKEENLLQKKNWGLFFMLFFLEEL